MEAWKRTVAPERCSRVTGSAGPLPRQRPSRQVQRPAISGAEQDSGRAVVREFSRVFFRTKLGRILLFYYDYLPAEAYVPSQIPFIEKDASINDHIEQMRYRRTRRAAGAGRDADYRCYRFQPLMV